ncbi:F0F1 ATP synthase subunit epsilon [Acidocella sp. MX-AZ02]|uniref:F0F1 ATP synthase subunit epsilon n=1 Tax=Acidocella sp. MX-AZ02 TaxID=1214225 RepID=UPI00028D6AA7|nr:ATP synthase subunit epsilon [Acidocella sp. MX-AZ02]EKN01072.1 ATP synthase subunit epsilon [Acidocella sp. MX-AZ02]
MPLALEIISPERLLLAREVDMVVVPGTEGDLGILPGHSKLVTSLRGGLVDIYEAGKITDRFFCHRRFRRGDGRPLLGAGGRDHPPG